MSTETVQVPLFEPIENALLSVGIKSARDAGILTFVLLSAYQWYSKPSMSFDENGSARPWTLMWQDNERDNARSTFFPWYLNSAILGTAVYLVI